MARPLSYISENIGPIRPLKQGKCSPHHRHCKGTPGPRGLGKFLARIRRTRTLSAFEFFGLERNESYHSVDDAVVLQAVAI